MADQAEQQSGGSLRRRSLRHKGAVSAPAVNAPGLNGASAASTNTVQKRSVGRLICVGSRVLFLNGNLVFFVCLKALNCFEVLVLNLSISELRTA